MVQATKKARLVRMVPTGVQRRAVVAESFSSNLTIGRPLFQDEVGKAPRAA